MKLVWSGDARKDRHSIFRYISLENPRAALALDETFSSTAEILMAYPEAGRPGRLDGTRELLAHKRYILLPGGRGEVRVLRVLHTSRQAAGRLTGIVVPSGERSWLTIG